MTILAHDVQAKQAERDRLAAEVAAWVERNGQPTCYGPEVSAAANSAPTPLTTEERRAKAIRQKKAMPR